MTNETLKALLMLALILSIELIFYIPWLPPLRQRMIRLTATRASAGRKFR